MVDTIKYQSGTGVNIIDISLPSKDSWLLPVQIVPFRGILLFPSFIRHGNMITGPRNFRAQDK